jgi:hypothetical protein
LIIIYIFALTIFAGMVKLVDMPDLGSGAARRVGSSPITRTEAQTKVWALFILYVFYLKKLKIILKIRLLS